ncbi:MAG: class F sortase [bacterium]
MVRNRPAFAVRRKVRGLARVVAGLALVAVVGACGSDEAGRTAGEQPLRFTEPSETPSPTPSETIEPVEVSETPLDPGESQAQVTSGRWALRIPEIGVEAPVVDLNSTEDRVLFPPRDPGLVGWWSQGAAPGDGEGSALLVGHSVSTGGGVFDEVDELAVGATIEVDNLTYQVQSVEVMSKDDLSRRAEELFDQSVPGGRLVVVTCEDWDGQTWKSNAVAIATPA